MTTAAKIHDSLLGKYSELVNKINYHNTSIAPFFSEMAAWEVKEYSDINEENLTEINFVKGAIMENEAIFNELLSDQNITVAEFLNN